MFCVKYNPDGSVLKYKTRLVAKGFLQNHGIDHAKTFSPVIKTPTIHALLPLVVTFD